jgi:hypothetical protein
MSAFSGPEDHTEHPDFQTGCSDDVHCQSITHPNEISSQSSSMAKAAERPSTDPFFQGESSGIAQRFGRFTALDQ